MSKPSLPQTSKHLASSVVAGKGPINDQEGRVVVMVRMEMF